MNIISYLFGKKNENCWCDGMFTHDSKSFQKLNIRIGQGNINFFRIQLTNKNYINMINQLKISFPDQSKSFTYGVEYGRLLEKMERGDDIILNNGFPIRIENKNVLEKTCKTFGYIPTFGKVHYDEWIEFLAIKKVSLDN